MIKNIGCKPDNQMILSMCQSILQNAQLQLDNLIKSDYVPCAEERTLDGMAKINRAVTIRGVKHWIRANSEQEYADKLLSLSGGVQVPATTTETIKHRFSDYAWNWFNVYSKPNVETATATTYKRQLDLYLIPAFGEKNIEDITVDDLQMLFNSVHAAKATKQKIKIVLNMILTMAMDDDIIAKNPLQSKRLKITGSSSKVTPEYTIEQMRYLVNHIGDIKNTTDRAYLALQALHPLRLEEVLGLTWNDIDFENMTISVRQVATHPTRNQPEIKQPKTEASIRVVGLSAIAAKYIGAGTGNSFVIGGEKPLSYQQVKRMCLRIQQDTGFTEKITPIRFRTTVLTDIYAATKDIKQAQAAAGHTTSAMTLKHYVKGRSDIFNTAYAIDSVYAPTSGIAN